MGIMKREARSPPTVILTLRLWHEQVGHDQSEWRGEIKNLSTGEMRYFRRWDEIAALARRMIGVHDTTSRTLPAEDTDKDM